VNWVRFLVLTWAVGTLLHLAYWFGWIRGHRKACQIWEERWRNTERFAAHWQDLARRLRNKANEKADEDWGDHKRDDPDWWKRQ